MPRNGENDSGLLETEGFCFFRASVVSGNFKVMWLKHVKTKTHLLHLLGSSLLVGT